MMTRNEFLMSMIHAVLVNEGTKKSAALVRDFEYSERKGYTDIMDAYGRCSNEKRHSFYAIANRAYNQGARRVYICGASSFSYSTCYSVEIVDDNTGEILTAYVKDTRDNTFVTILHEEALANIA